MSAGSGRGGAEPERDHSDGLPPPEAHVPAWFEAALAFPVAAGSAQIAGRRIALRRWGAPTDPPMILVHGNSANARWWDHVAPLLAVSGFCVTAMDLSGHGDSQWRVTYSWARWADEVVGVVETAPGVGRPYVVAHSMGARVAVQAATLIGDDWRGLVVIDAALPVRREELPVSVRGGRFRAVERTTYATVEEAVARFRLQGVPDWVGLPFVLRHVAECSLETVEGGRVAWKRDVRVAVRSDRRPGPEILARVRTPIAWICAEHGRVPSAIRSAYPAVLGRSVPVVEIPDAYHHLMMDRPLALVSALRGMLAVWPWL